MGCSCPGCSVRCLTRVRLAHDRLLRMRALCRAYLTASKPRPILNISRICSTRLSVPAMASTKVAVVQLTSTASVDDNFAACEHFVQVVTLLNIDLIGCGYLQAAATSMMSSQSGGQSPDGHEVIRLTCAACKRSPRGIA
jgi:hypothetical protein